MFKKNKIENFYFRSSKIRLDIINMLFKAQSGHSGPSLSIVEILNYLFFEKKIYKIFHDRDNFVLSKGHAVPALYSVLYNLNFINKKELLSFRDIGTKLQGHPDRTKLKYIELGTGALGQGLSVSIGFALANLMLKKNKKSFCLVGDGEIQEGQIWEAAMYAGSHNLNNLCLILDNNRMQNETFTNKTLDIMPLKKKWEAFNWKVLEIDGHSFAQIEKAFNKFYLEKQRPTVIIANTTKGKGISFMENSAAWHSKVLDEKSYLVAKKELI
jgi:transketolase